MNCRQFCAGVLVMSSVQSSPGVRHRGRPAQKRQAISSEGNKEDRRSSLVTDDSEPQPSDDQSEVWSDSDDDDKEPQGPRWFNVYPALALSLLIQFVTIAISLPGSAPFAILRASGQFAGLVRSNPTWTRIFILLYAWGSTFNVLIFGFIVHWQAEQYMLHSVIEYIRLKINVKAQVAILVWAVTFGTISTYSVAEQRRTSTKIFHELQQRESLKGARRRSSEQAVLVESFQRARKSMDVRLLQPFGILLRDRAKTMYWSYQLVSTIPAILSFCVTQWVTDDHFKIICKRLDTGEFNINNCEVRDVGFDMRQMVIEVVTGFLAMQAGIRALTVFLLKGEFFKPGKEPSIVPIMGGEPIRMRC